MNKILHKGLGLITLVLVTGCSCRASHVRSAAPMAMMNQEQLLSRSENVSMRTINFAYDRSDLSNASKDTLQRNAQLLRTSSTMKVTVEGHADERGTTAYNLRLGKNRALAAADYLISLGIPPERISSVSCGEKCPLDTQHNELAWAANRRVEFKDTGRD